MTPEERQAIIRLAAGLEARKNLTARIQTLTDEITQDTARRQTLVDERTALDQSMLADLALIKGT